MSTSPSVLEDPRWANLSKVRRDELLEKYRDFEVGFDGWWESTDTYFKERMLDDHGIFVSKTYFSGFWSQGDGASFEGQVVDWDKVLDLMKHPEWKRWGWERGWTFNITSQGHYCHELSMRFSGELDRPQNPFDEDTELLQHDAWEHTSGAPTEGQLDQFWKDLEEQCREFAREYYSSLETEYDYLTSSEVVVQFLLENHKEELVELEEDEVATADL